MADYTEKIVWHEVTTRPPTEEESEEYKSIYGEDPAFVFDSQMPDDGQEILVKTVYGVDKDICYIDGGAYLEGREWEDVLAWAEMPTGKGDEADG